MSVFPQFRQPFYCRSMQYNELLGTGAHQGEVRLCVTDGAAYLYDSGQDFSRWCLPSGVSNKGARRYQVFVYEGTDVITGFFDIHNTSESLGSELLGTPSLYPEFEATWVENRLALRNWSGGLGVFSPSCTDGKLYKLTFKAAQTWGPGGRYYSDLTITFAGKSWTVNPFQAGDDIDYPTEYNSYSYYLTSNSASPSLDFYKPSGYPGHVHVIWDISLKEVTAPTAWRSIKIFDAQCGGAQNWCGGKANIPSGFDYQSFGGLTYKIIPLF